MRLKRPWDSSEGLIESAINNSYQPIINTLGDIDTSLASRATEIICSPKYSRIEMVALAARDNDYMPIVYRAREYNKKILAVGMKGNGFSTALKNSADYFEVVEERLKEEMSSRRW